MWCVTACCYCSRTGSEASRRARKTHLEEFAFCVAHRFWTRIEDLRRQETDWFVDPFDGRVDNTAPILFFVPGPDYVLNGKVNVSFRSKWDAGALMVWADDHHWAKLSFELSPEKQPTMVTVVTRGLSDDCNSIPLSGNDVYLQIARTGNTYVFYSSTNGRDWKILRTFSLDSDLQQMVGFEAQSPAGSGANVTFSEIHYSPAKIKNIYTGQ